MKKITEEALTSIDVDVVLTDHQRAVLAGTVKQEMFDVLQTVMEDQLKKFNIRLLNTDPGDQGRVLVNHLMAKAAAQFYKGMMERIESECQVWKHNNDLPQVMTSDLPVEEFN